MSKATPRSFMFGSPLLKLFLFPPIDSFMLREKDLLHYR